MLKRNAFLALLVLVLCLIPTQDTQAQDLTYSFDLTLNGWDFDTHQLVLRDGVWVAVLFGQVMLVEDVAPVAHDATAEGCGTWVFEGTRYVLPSYASGSTMKAAVVGLRDELQLLLDAGGDLKGPGTCQVVGVFSGFGGCAGPPAQVCLQGTPSGGPCDDPGWVTNCLHSMYTDDLYGFSNVSIVFESTPVNILWRVRYSDCNGARQEDVYAAPAC